MSERNDRNDDCGGARWTSEVLAVLAKHGWKVERSWGSNDYQGSGCVLASRGAVEWAAYAWTYGSCGGCDQWEDEQHTLEPDVLSELETFATEAEAVSRYESMADSIW